MHHSCGRHARWASTLKHRDSLAMRCCCSLGLHVLYRAGLTNFVNLEAYTAPSCLLLPAVTWPQHGQVQTAAHFLQQAPSLGSTASNALTRGRRQNTISRTSRDSPNDMQNGLCLLLLAGHLLATATAAGREDAFVTYHEGKMPGAPAQCFAISSTWPRLGGVDGRHPLAWPATD